MKYRKKPVVIEAVLWDGCPKALKEIQDMGLSRDDFYLHRSFMIRTLEGDMLLNIGDYLIKGVNGEFYPCKADIFKATYEEVK